MARTSFARAHPTAIGTTKPFIRATFRDADGNVYDPNTYIYGNERRRLKALRSTASRRVKVTLRRLGKQGLHEADVLRAALELKQRLRNKA
jgi:hypothetical protein